MRAVVAVSVICPACGFVMRNSHDRTQVACLTDGCDNAGKMFEVEQIQVSLKHIERGEDHEQVSQANA